MYQTAFYRRDPQDYDEDTYTARRKCSTCGETRETTVPAPGLFAYRKGEFAQVAFPDLSASDREFYFISGVCGNCWNELFGEVPC